MDLAFQPSSAAVHLSLVGRGREQSERVRGPFVLRARLSLTRRFAPTSPHWGEVKHGAVRAFLRTV